MALSVCWRGLAVGGFWRTHGFPPRVCVLEPAAAEPDRTLSHRAEPEPPRLPDPAAGGAARPNHTYTRTLLQEKTAPWRQHHPQQVCVCVCFSCKCLFGAIICSSQRMVTFLLHVVPCEGLQTISDGSLYAFVYRNTQTQKNERKHETNKHQQQ